MMHLFAVGTIWFWLLITLVVGIVLAMVESDEESGWGFIPVAVGVALLYFMGAKEAIVSLVNYVAQNPGIIIMGSVVYLILGSAWSLFKWYLYCTDLKSKYISDGAYLFGYKSDFDVKRNKTKILNWMMYWPISAIWTTIDKPFKRAFVRIFAAMQGRFQKIADRVVAEIDEKTGKGGK